MCDLFTRGSLWHAASCTGSGLLRRDPPLPVPGGAVQSAPSSAGSLFSRLHRPGQQRRGRDRLSVLPSSPAGSAEEEQGQSRVAAVERAEAEAERAGRHGRGESTVTRARRRDKNTARPGETDSERERKN